VFISCSLVQCEAREECGLWST